jgi:hypothetical protein
MKGENDIRPAVAAQRAMRTGLSLHSPADLLESGQHEPCFRGEPSTHAARKVTVNRSAGASLCSRRSAITRNAKAWTCATASSRVLPYVSTPAGQHRPPRRLGALSPRYSFVLNPHVRERFTKCPTCNALTRVRKTRIGHSCRRPRHAALNPSQQDVPPLSALRDAHRRSSRIGTSHRWRGARCARLRRAGHHRPSYLASGSRR